MLDSSKADALQSSLRGQVIRPQDAGYDAARRILQRHDRQTPGLIARCVDVADVIAVVNFARENTELLAFAAVDTTAPDLALCDDGLVIDLSYAGHPRRPRHQNRACRSRLRLGRRGPRLPPLRTGGAHRNHCQHGRGRTDARRRRRLPRAEIRSDHRQSAGRRYGAGRWPIRHRKRRPECRPLLGGTRRRRQFWCCHVVRFRGQPVKTVFGSPVLEAGQGRGCHALVSDFLPKAPDDINGWFAFVKVPPGRPSRSRCIPKQCVPLSGGILGRRKTEEVYKPIRQFAARFCSAVPFRSLPCKPCSMGSTGRLAMVLEGDFVQGYVTKPLTCT